MFINCCTLIVPIIEAACVDRYNNAVKQLELARKEVDTILECSGLSRAQIPHLENALSSEEDERLSRPKNGQQLCKVTFFPWSFLSH